MSEAPVEFLHLLRLSDLICKNGSTRGLRLVTLNLAVGKEAGFRSKFRRMS